MSIPQNYQSILTVKEKLEAINEIREFMEKRLLADMNCRKVEGPLIVESNTGINDQLDSKKQPVKFTVDNKQGESCDPIDVEVIQATTKWKRWALKQYGFNEGEGLFVDMRGIRKDYFLDMNHSCYVNQWDWEVIISEENKRIEYLKAVVKKLYKIVLDASKHISSMYRQLGDLNLPDEIVFIHAEDLYQRFPNMDRNEREEAILKEHKAVFLIGIGYPLTSGQPHEDRASDYDDWYTAVKQNNGQTRRGLNGDILVWNDVIQRRFELSSMGIRVDPETLNKQLEIAKQTDLRQLMFDTALLSGDLPLTIGGGIGQARVFQLLLKCAHIGEVSVAPWSKKERDSCKTNNIHLL